MDSGHIIRQKRLQAFRDFDRTTGVPRLRLTGEGHPAASVEAPRAWDGQVRIPRRRLADGIIAISMILFLDGPPRRLLARSRTCRSLVDIESRLPVDVRMLDMAPGLFELPLFPHTASHAGVQVIRSYPGVSQDSARCSQ